MPSLHNPHKPREATRLPAMVRTLAGAAALASALPPVVHATQYSLEYEVDTRYNFNDNVGLRPDNEVDVNGVELALPAALSISEERYNAYARGEISSSKYDDSGYNSDDQELELGGEYKFERGGIKASAGIDRDSTTDTAFLDNGVVGATADRVERYTAGVNGLYYLSQSNALIGGVNYTQNDYDTPTLVDNESRGGYLGMSHQYTENTVVQLQAYVSRFENDARIGVESDSVGLQAGFSTNFTENLSVSALGGYSEVETEYFAVAGLPVPDDDDTSGWILNSALDYTGDRSSVRASFSRRETASADGYLIVNNQLEVEYDYQLTERVKVLLEVIAGNSGALNEDIDNDRDYASGKIRGTYQLTENWFLSAGYTHRYQDRERASGDASANIADVSIIFKPNPLSWSR